MKKTLSVLICLCMLAVCVVPSFAAQVTYPQGVTNETAAQSVQKTDALIKNVLKEMKNTTLRQMVMPMLYSDETLSSMLTGLYTSFGEQKNALSVLGIDISTKNVAACLSAYPSVSQAVAAAGDWESVSLEDATWGIESEEGFVNAVSAMFTPLNELVYVILCSGTYRSGFISIKGDNGYQNGVVPILNTLGCTSILSSDEFKAQADADRSSMVKNIVRSVLSMVESVLDAPADRLTEIGPNLAYFMNNGGMDESVNALVNPLKIGIGGYITLFSGSTLFSLVGSSEESDGNTVSALLDTVTQSSGLKLAELDTELLASCGTQQDGKIIPDKGAAYVVILSWLIETAKLNKDMLMSELSGEEAESMKPVIENLLAKSTDELLSLLVGLFTNTQGTDTEYQWPTPQFTAGSVTYTPNLGSDKYQRVVEGIDETLGEFIAESGEYKNLSQMLKAQIYSSATVSQIAVEIYSQLSDGDMKQAAAILDLPSTPAGLASTLGSEFSSAKSTLSKYSSWKKVNPSSVSWGFKAGDSDGFEKALVAVLSPLDGMLNMLLRSGSMELFDSISLCGSSGYNTAVIPILEALGCPSESIMTYNEYKADTSENACVKNLVTPIMALLDKVIEKPIYTLTEILPNIVFFIQNGSMLQCINNLLTPLTTLMNQLSVSEEQLGLDKIKNIDILSEISKMIPEMAKDSMTLPQPDLTVLGNLGQLEVVSSKRTYQGGLCQAFYVKADQPAVMVTLLRYFVTGMKDPENADLLTNMMAGSSSEGENNMFATYSANIGTEMEQMTVDETIEWLYKLFFRERAVSSAVSDDYTPTIIYVESKKGVAVKAVLAVLLVLLAAAVIVCIIKREVIFDYIEEKRQQKLKKKHEAEIEQYRLNIREEYLKQQEKLKQQAAQTTSDAGSVPNTDKPEADTQPANVETQTNREV